MADMLANQMQLRMEAQQLIRELARPGEAGETVKAAMRRVSLKLTDWNWNRIREIWWCNPKVRIWDEEITQLRAAVECERAQTQVGAKEFALLQMRVSALEKYLMALNSHMGGTTGDPNWHSDCTGMRTFSPEARTLGE